jgi:hypothetical protein
VVPGNSYKNDRLLASLDSGYVLIERSYWRCDRGQAMGKKDFRQVIAEFISENWEDAVHEGEARYSGVEVGTRHHISKIKEFAQLKMVSSLADIKGDWLTVEEMHYALDQFNWRASRIDYFKILRYQSVSVLGEFRSMLATESAS